MRQVSDRHRLSPGVHGRSLYLSLFLLSVVLLVGPIGCERNSSSELRDPEVNRPVVIGQDTLHPPLIRAYLAEALGFTSRGGRVQCSYTMLAQVGDQVYLWSLCEELVASTDSLVAGSGSSGPVALQVDTRERPLNISGHRVPRDGNLYAADIREIFPRHVQRQIFAETGAHNRRSEALQRANRTAHRPP